MKYPVTYRGVNYDHSEAQRLGLEPYVFNDDLAAEIAKFMEERNRSLLGEAMLNLEPTHALMFSNNDYCEMVKALLVNRYKGSREQ